MLMRIWLLEVIDVYFSLKFQVESISGISNKSMDNPQDWPLIERSASSYTDDEEEKTDAGVLEYENIVDRNTKQNGG